LTFAVGSLVRARNREWIVLPESTGDLLVVRPLGGTDDEIAGICLPLENVEHARFALPDLAQLGDFHSCGLLRDAVRLGFRSSAGPFRSFGKIAVDPRPYQLVPLLVALKLNPIRILIADDVGIGKTIEAILIAREMLDRGEICRMAVLCPPHLAEQWEKELREKFHIDATRVIPSTATKLERNLPIGRSLFDVYPYVIVSMDFIKSDRRRDEFLRACPELVIVDEAHSCAYGYGGRGGRHQRFQLISRLSEDKDRHLILVTATPHSGKEEEFRSLLSFLDKDFADLPADISGDRNKEHRRRLSAHFVQRRRRDIRHYMREDTPFPEREDAEATYTLSPEYRRLFDKALRYASEIISTVEGTGFQKRIRWWSALALLRSLASSPAAAAATLRNRAAVADTESEDEADELGRRSIMDADADDSAVFVDATPGSDTDAVESEDSRNRRRLREMAREADALHGKKDNKVVQAAKHIRGLVADGFNPIVFCRFIPTAEYVAGHLREELPSSVEIVAVTGLLPPEEREARIEQLGTAPKRVLVATDCLSEGINLQQHFDAVFHYDLCWNPTRHEQREGRADRFGQPNSKVRVLTYYGRDNQIDGIVLDVLLRKHKTIRSQLGIIVPVPADTNSVVEALYQGLLLRGRTAPEQFSLDFARPDRERLHTEWDNATAREKRSRTMFAQESIKVEEVARELEQTQASIGAGVDVERFTREALKTFGAAVEGDGTMTANLRALPSAMREAIGNSDTLKGRFCPPVGSGVAYLNRTHPIVEGLATYVLNTALDQGQESKAKRCGAIRTNAVSRRTTLLLLRLRYHIVTIKGGEEYPLLAEDSLMIGFTGSPENPEWLSTSDTESLLAARPSGNIGADHARDLVGRVVDGISAIAPKLEELARHRGEEILEAHKRVRSAAGIKWVSYRVEPHLPPDVLGIYICLPAT
jgi:hypothetical protein